MYYLNFLNFNGAFFSLTVKPELPLDLVADLDTLPILTTAPNIRSYDQESLEDSLIVREQSQTKTCQILDDETIRTKSLPEIHKLILNQSKVPQIFVDKLVSLHMGHLSLSVEDLSEYFFHLDRIFNTFAHHSQDFLTLSKNDQAALLIANAPLYYHLYLTRQVNIVFIGEFQNYLHEVRQNFTSPKVNPQLNQTNKQILLSHFI